MIFKFVIFIISILLAYTVNIYYNIAIICVITVLTLHTNPHYLIIFRKINTINTLLLSIGVVFIFSTIYCGFYMVAYFTFYHELNFDFILFDTVKNKNVDTIHFEDK